MDCAQTLHEPVQELLQQTLSAQAPDTQSAAVAQVWPLMSLQAPFASHALLPEHVSESGPDFTVMHVPGVKAQLLHVPVQDASQQKPSTHLLVVHSLPA
jgi:hypothetical protein